MATLYCDPALGTGSDDGTSWENAYKTIAHALSHASSGDDIWIKASTTTLSAELTMVDGVKLYGGFAESLTGTSGSIAGRNLNVDITTIYGATTCRCLSISVASSTIDGIKFYRGSAGASYGGGIAITAGNHTVSNCTFLSCSATSGGGLDFRPSGDTTVNINNCTFTSCSATSYAGGGITASKSTGYLVVDNCTFTSCTSSTTGGGVYCNALGTIKNSKFYSCSYSGSANCGGGICFNVSSTVSNCVVTDCSGRYGGGVGVLSGTVDITNCTVCANTATHSSTASGGGIYRTAGTCNVTNCIVRDNTAKTSDNELSGTMTVTYSDIEGGYTGTGNIDSAPTFRSSYSGHPYEHLGSSACIDAANSGATGYLTTDILGRARYDDPLTSNTGTGTPNYADMGAYEYQGKFSLFPSMQ